MLEVDLPRHNADFVWSLCAVEHVGGPNEVYDALRQAAALVRPNG